MTVTQRGPSNRYLDRPSPSSLADVIDTILDKGLVIDIHDLIHVAVRPQHPCAFVVAVAPGANWRMCPRSELGICIRENCGPVWSCPRGVAGEVELT
jgi:hypothetical protein